jgi:hypothetical protein
MLISWRFLVPEKYRFFLEKRSIFLASKSRSSALFFSVNADLFHEAECDMRGAWEKHAVSTVSLCIKNKPNPIVKEKKGHASSLSVSFSLSY